MNVDFKNYNKPGILPEYFEIIGEIVSGKFPITLHHRNTYVDEDNGPSSYIKTFDYCFDFVYKKRVTGKAFVYHGGFQIQYKRPYGLIYTSSHCNNFSMPMCQHFTSAGDFTQFFIDRISKEFECEAQKLIVDEVGAITRYANQRKGK